MAEQRLNGLTSLLPSMAQTPWLRQLLILVGIAASVALGFATVLWSKGTDYRLLYSSLAPERAAQVVDTLNTLNIPYKLEQQTGGILVPEDKLNDARLKLAGSGFAKGDGSGLEMVQDEKGFAVSEFMEGKKYEHALEIELERTIESLHQVRKARVHLAIPKQSVFVGEAQPATASIMLDVYPGSTIENKNVIAIVNLVASSIPNLKPEQVTVVDQQGNLLSKIDHNDDLELSTRQFDYREHVEKEYEGRIQDLLSPIIATGRVKTQVSADVDFSTQQQSTESWDPQHPVVRSEQLSSNQSSEAAAGGIPGALSNQPMPAPAAATAPAQTQSSGSSNPGNGTSKAAIAAAAAAAASKAATPAPIVNGSTSTVRNYEIDRTLSHSSVPSGRIRSLTVAVVVDNNTLKDKHGHLVRPAPNAAEIDRMTTLVKDAIGFNAERGDRVTVVSAPFRVDPDANEVVAAPAFWQSEGFASTVKQGLAGVAVLIVALGVLRPAMRQLMATPVINSNGRDAYDGHDSQMAQNALPGSGKVPLLASASSSPVPRLSHDLENKMNSVRFAASEDPRLVAQVVKSWVSENAS